MISVIMPAYKAQQGITRTVESLLNQSYGDFEIICVDDCSPDGTVNILNQLSASDNRVKVIQNPENRGAGFCRNLGLSRAKGEYCLFLDCDDFFERDFIRDMYAKISETGADICFCNYTFVNSDGEEISRTDFGAGVENPFVPGEHFSHLYQLTHSVPWNKIFRTDFIKSHHMMYAELSSSNDLSFTLLAFSLATKIAYLDGSYIQYTKGDKKSTTMSLKDSHVENVLKAYDILLSNINRLSNGRDYYETFNVALNRSLNYRLKLRSNYRVSYKSQMSEDADFLKYRKESGCQGDLASAYIENQPLITIIVYVSGNPEFWTESLNSLVNQTFKSIRIVALNSLSDCDDILESFREKDSRISVVKSAVGDIYRNIQKVLRDITSPFVMFCKTGEIYKENACMEFFYGLIKSGKDICFSDIDLLVGDYSDYHFNVLKSDEYRSITDVKVNLQRLFAKASNKIYRNSIIRKNGLIFESETRFLESYCRLASDFSEIPVPLISETYFHKSEVVGKPDVSVIIPIYNVKSFLTDTLRSVCNQTLKNIEIICVDDCSTDGSGEIVELYRKIDPRIKVLRLERNSSALVSRKRGVEISTGRYVMFLDGDDALEKNACETAFNAIEKSGTDLLMFGTNVVNFRNQCSSRRIRRFKNFVAPYLSRIEKNDNLLGSVFEEKLFSFNLWNKIYAGDLCRSVVKDMPEYVFHKANDVFMMVYLLSGFRSYDGISDCLYDYKLGAGVTGTDLMSQEMFEVMLSEHDVFRKLEKHLESLNGDYAGVILNLRRKLMSESIVKFINNTQNIRNDDNMTALVNLWGYDDVVKSFAEYFWNEPKKISDKISGYLKCKRPDKNIKTIAFYYRSICNGGAQRVSQLLCDRLAAIRNTDGSYKYSVVLITDEADVGEKEYPLSRLVKRAFLPNKDLSKEALFASRYDGWRKIITENDIDVVISGHWMDECSFWDMLAVKAMGQTYYVSHSHNFFAVPFYHKNAYKTSGSVLATYINCDGVVNLSECDRLYTSMYCGNTVVIPNPLTFSPQKVPMNFLDNNTVCWVGRISHEKNPVDLIRAMNVVHQSIPDAELIIVGDGDESILKSMLATVDDLGLGDSVEFVGFTENVEKYYAKASLFVNTSKYEGFSMTFAEAMSYGIPVVTYDMPWLTFIENGGGIVTVEQNDYLELGNTMVRILSDRTYLRNLGTEARKNAASVAGAPIEEMWQNFLDGLSAYRSNVMTGDELKYRKMFDYLTSYSEQRYELTSDYHRRQNERLSNSNSELRAKNNEVYKALKDNMLELLRLKTDISHDDKTDGEVPVNPLGMSEKLLEKGAKLVRLFGRKQ